MIKYAAKIRDRPLLVAAIEAKIEQIERLLRNAYDIRNLGFAQAIEPQASASSLLSSASGSALIRCAVSAARSISIYFLFYC